MKKIALGVNIDHVATLRQARGGREPDPVWAAACAELAGAQGITIHLREDRRHIQDHDLVRLKKTVQVKLNLEMSVAADIVRIACRVRPCQATLVPERRQELTTEGGLNVAGGLKRVKRAVDALGRRKIFTSLFIDPDPKQIKASVRAGAQAVELHTGRYANAPHGSRIARREIESLRRAAALARDYKLRVYAGHGLHFMNVGEVARMEFVEELNIGHSIVSRSVFVGLDRAVREMKEKIREALL